VVQLYKRKGGEVLVNTQTLNNQSGGNLAVLAGGGFVVTWIDGSMIGADTSSFGVKAQRFDASGNPLGSEFLVNTTVTGSQGAPVIAALPSGRFVITWTDASATGGDTSGNAVRGQMFEANGTPVGAEFLVNFQTIGNQSSPAIAELAGGGFVVSWTDSGSGGGVPRIIKGMVFDSAGAVTAGEFQLNTASQGTAGATGIGVIGLPGGGFAAVYGIFGPVSGQVKGTIWLQMFDATGTKVGAEQVVNSEAVGNFSAANITALNDGFVVTWSQQDSVQFPGVPVTFDVHAQLFNAAGAKIGAELIVNTTTAGTQIAADVDRLPGGGFIVTWNGPAEGTSDLNIYGQFFDDSGDRIGGEFLVNTITDGNQSGSRIDVLPSGDIVITWTDGSAIGADSSGSGIKMQILTLSADAPTDIALSDAQISEVAIENLAVATLSATNVNAVNSHVTYAIVSDASGGAFRIEGDKLVVGDSSKLDFENRPNIDVRIRATDLNGTAYEETLTVAVGDAATEARYSADVQFTVTATTTGFNGPVATIALGGGGYALITNWLEIGLGSGFRVQTFDSAGDPLGEPIDFHPSGSGQDMVAQALPDGGFVAAYRGSSVPAGSFPICMQMFDSSGHPVGPERVASTSNSNGPSDPSVAVLDDGRIVVTWTLHEHEDGASSTPFPSQIVAQMFDGGGAKIGGEFRVNTGIEGGQAFSDVAAAADGGFLVTWRDGTAVEAQLFNAAGTKVGNERVIVSSGAESSNLVALDNGTFLVTWDEIVAEVEGVTLIGIGAQRIGADGINIGDPIIVLPFGSASPHYVAALDGGFVVSWSQYTPEANDDPDYTDNWAQMFDLSGLPIGEAFQVSGEQGNGQRVARVAASADGDLLFAWDYEYVDSTFSAASNMLARVFTREGATIPGGGATEGPDVLNGTSGSDQINGLGGNDVINGLEGDDLLTGGGGSDYLIGLGGNDILVGGADAASTLQGGTGNDWYYVNNTGDSVLESASEGADRIVASVSFTLSAGQEVETLVTADQAATAAINLTGNDLAQVIFGNAGANILTGGGGADYLLALGGDDILFGNADAASTLQGGTGNDWYYIYRTGDSLVEFAGEGTDRIFTTVSYTLSAGQEIETLATADSAGAATINLTGNALGQNIFGNAGANTLTGGGGTDTLIGYGGDDILFGNADAASTLQGGAGNDWYYITQTGDSLVEFAGEGNDRILTSVSYTLSAGQEIETLSALDSSGSAAINLAGNGFAQFIQGTNGANILSGDGGADILAGLGGGDVLLGGDGDDFLNGGLGSDTLNGGAGADMFVFADALGLGNIDSIQDFVSGSDRVALDHNVFAGLSAGALSSGAFVIGTAAQDADDRILYDSATGALWFDADGNGAGAAVQFATLSGHPTVLASDFVVI
jgi:Ca2+-binding RTX toxin-like protein